MPDPAFSKEEMDEFVEEYKNQDEPYTVFYKEKKAIADREGQSFPALETFRKALEKSGIDTGRKKKSPSKPSSKDPEYFEYLENFLREHLKEDPENSFLRWKNKRLQERLEELEKEKK